VTANPEPGESANIVTIAPGGTDRRRLTTFDDGRNAFVGSYSPDGTQIVMRLERGETYSLATIPSGGGAITRLTTGKTRPRFIDWGTHG
jgi:Tol biopolymer transport system component